MLEIFSEFRKKLDQVMIKAINRRVVLYGYGRSGQFIQWYADYYHSIKIDFIVRENMKTGIPYSFPSFPPSVFDFNYKDINNAIIWITFADSEKAKAELKRLGFKEGKDYFDFCEIVYGEDKVWESDNGLDVFTQRKTGNRDIQFLEYLEYKYGCNFVTEIDKSHYYREGICVGYKVTTLREIFSILDKCHCIPNASDAILDIGAGKGGGVFSFLDYGFETVGGVELEERIYHVLKHNMELIDKKIGGKVELLCMDAMQLTSELDIYNWFYCFLSDGEHWINLAKNIRGSIERKPRKVTIIVRNPYALARESFEQNGFILINSFSIDTRQRVVNVYTNDV